MPADTAVKPRRHAADYYHASPFIMPHWFGAVDGGDSNAGAAIRKAIEASLNDRKPVNGNAMVYGLDFLADGPLQMPSGTWLENITFRQLSPGAGSTVCTLQASGVDRITLKAVRVDKNGRGDNDGKMTVGSYPNGYQSTAFVINIVGGRQHHLEDVEVFGNDSCSAIRLRELDRTSTVIRPYVHDSLAVQSGANDDIQRGILIQLCDGLTVICPRVERLTQQEGLATSVRYKFNKAIAASGNSNLVLVNPRIAFCGTAIDFSGNLGSGNTDCWVICPTMEDCGIRGLKLANWTRRTHAIGGYVARCPEAAVVGTASWNAEVTDREANWVTDFTAVDCGDGSAAFYSNPGAGAGEYNVPIKFRRCRAIDRRGTPLMKYGFQDIVTWTGLARSEVLDGCTSEGAIKGTIYGFQNQPADDGNLLPNPAFHLGDQWWSTSPNGDVGCVIVADGEAETGYYALRFDDTTGVGEEVQNVTTVPCAPDETIYAAMRYKTDASPTISSLRVRIKWLDKDGAVLSNSQSSNFTSAAPSYTWVSVTGTAPSSTAAAQFEIINTKTAGTIWVDRVMFVKQWTGGTLISDYSGGTIYTKTANFTVNPGESRFINNKSAANCTVTLPAASSSTGREIWITNYQAQAVVSASSNVVPLGGGAAGTAILAATVGKWASLVSDGSNWIIMQAN